VRPGERAHLRLSAQTGQRLLSRFAVARLLSSTHHGGYGGAGVGEGRWCGQGGQVGGNAKPVRCFISQAGAAKEIAALF